MTENCTYPIELFQWCAISRTLNAKQSKLIEFRKNMNWWSPAGPKVIYRSGCMAIVGKRQTIRFRRTFENKKTLTNGMEVITLKCECATLDIIVNITLDV